MGCDDISSDDRDRMMFQSTHPCGVRQLWHTLMMTKFMFQSTHPCGVRRGFATTGYRFPSFNPRTRVGCDAKLGFDLLRNEFQSTHPCGVRHLAVRLSRLENVSIHAPVWGATIANTIKPFIRGFQSTHPCGVRHLACYLPKFINSFNPRTRVGCDDSVLQAAYNWMRFNPRTRCGVRH